MPIKATAMPTRQLNSPGLSCINFPTDTVFCLPRAQELDTALPIDPSQLLVVMLAAGETCAEPDVEGAGVGSVATREVEANNVKSKALCNELMESSIQ